MHQIIINVSAPKCRSPQQQSHLMKFFRSTIIASLIRICQALKHCAALWLSKQEAGNGFWNSRPVRWGQHFRIVVPAALKSFSGMAMDGRQAILR